MGGESSGVAPLGDLPISASRVDSALDRWLVAVRTHVLAVHFFVAVLLAVSGNVVVFAIRLHIPGVLETITLEGLIVLVAIAVPAVLTMGTLRREFRAIMGLSAAGPGPAAPILLRFVREELEELQDLLGDLRGQGAFVDQEGVSDWVRRRCFVATRGRYVSSDSCVPTVFLERYKELMAAHADYLLRTGLKDSVRICVASRQEILADYAANPAAVSDYVAWHQRNNVALLHLDREQAEALATRRKLAGVIDWSLWSGEVVIAWEYVVAGLRLRLSFTGEPTYRRCYGFLHDVMESAGPFDLLFGKAEFPSDDV